MPLTHQVRLRQNEALACLLNMGSSPLASRLVCMASVPSLLVEALLYSSTRAL
jgi:hypothetical protein